MPLSSAQIPPSPSSNKHTLTLKSLIVRTGVYLRKVTCSRRVNFQFFIEIAKMSHLELVFIWWQFFITSDPEKNRHQSYSRFYMTKFVIFMKKTKLTQFGHVTHTTILTRNDTNLIRNIG